MKWRLIAILIFFVLFEIGRPILGLYVDPFTSLVLAFVTTWVVWARVNP